MYLCRIYNNGAATYYCYFRFHFRQREGEGHRTQSESDLCYNYY